MILVNRESQIQEFELPIVSVQQIPSGCAVCTRAPHVLSQSVEG